MKNQIQLLHTTLELLFVALAVVALMPIFASCEKNPLPVEPATITLTATMEQPTPANSTKTALGTTSEGTTPVNWSSGDQIKIFATAPDHWFETIGAVFTLSGAGGTTSGTFTGTLEGDPASLIAYYPAAKVTSVTAEGVFTVTLPDTQKYEENSFGNEVAPMVAFASEGTNLTFKNLCGMVKISLTGDKTVKSIVLSSRRLLCGVGTVTDIYTDSPKLTLTAGINEVTLDCSNEIGGGVTLTGEATDFYIVVPPTAEGITTNDFIVQIVTTDGTNNIMTKEATARASNKFVRSKILKMPSFDYSPDVTLYYVQNGVNHGAGTTIGSTTWAPVNCGYEPATITPAYKGYPYGKHYQWGRRYGQGYMKDTYEDASYPSGADLVSGPTTLEDGQKIENADKFYTATMPPNDWLNASNNTLWGATKTAYDPCPAGWRVPTRQELQSLGNIANHYTDFDPSYWKWQDAGNDAVTPDGQAGIWCGTAEAANATVGDIQGCIFLPASGYRGTDGTTNGRGISGFYWSSTPNSADTYYLHFYSGYSNVNNNLRVYGFSVRCVKD